MGFVDPGVIAADLNEDGRVDALDFLLLVDSWGACDRCPADLDVDGIVWTEDLMLLLGSWQAADDP